MVLHEFGAGAQGAPTRRQFDRIVRAGEVAVGLQRLRTAGDQ
jgi:hypothetical protein